MTTTIKDPLADARWFKASRTNGANACVEVALTPGVVGVRDSKNITGGRLEMPPTRWTAFLHATKNGLLDL